MTARLDAAATVTSPAVSAAADVTHEAGVIFRVANTTVSGNACAAPIPKNCRGAHMRLLTIGANVDWGWLLDDDGVGGADTAPTLVYGQTERNGYRAPGCAAHAAGQRA
jgi:hypothetical protein